MKTILIATALLLTSCSTTISLKRHSDGNFSLENERFCFEMTKRGDIQFVRQKDNGLFLSQPLRDQLLINGKVTEWRVSLVEDEDGIILTSRDDVSLFRRSVAFDQEQISPVINYSFKNRKASAPIEVSWQLKLPDGIKAEEKDGIWTLSAGRRPFVQITSPEKLILQDDSLRLSRPRTLNKNDRTSWKVQMKIL